MARQPYDSIAALTVMLAARADRRKPVLVANLEAQLETIARDARLEYSIEDLFATHPDYIGALTIDGALRPLRSEGSVRMVKESAYDELLPLLRERAEALRERIPSHYYDALQRLGMRIVPYQEQR